MLGFQLLKEYLYFKALTIIILAEQVNSKFCNGGHFCSPPKECCPLGCCIVFTSQGYRPTVSQTSQPFSSASFLLWNHWMIWVLLVISLFILICGCGIWKKRQFFANIICNSHTVEELSELDSNGSSYPPPQYSRCSSFQFAPPPYTEVTSKPNLYPLVISYKSDDGIPDDNCIMVQYYKNYIVHSTLGSLSGESTVDSISSSFFNQSVHENDSTFPPTYEESRTEVRNSFERESIPLGTSWSCNQNQYLSQVKALTSNTNENINRLQGKFQTTAIGHMNPQIKKENRKINKYESIQKPSMTTPRLTKSSLPETIKNSKTLRNVTKSLPDDVFFESIVGQNKIARPNNLCLKTFKQIDKSVLFSTTTDTIDDNNRLTHQYSSDIILAQPQSYCDSNSEQKYYSTDILNHTSYSSEDNLSQPRGSLQDFVSSDGLSHSQFSNLEINNFSSSDVSSLQGCGSPNSPPQATSPTGEFLNLLDKIQKLPVYRDSNKFFDSSKIQDHRFEEPILVQEYLTSKQLCNENYKLFGNNLKIKPSLQNKLTESKPKQIGSICQNNLLSKNNFLSKSKSFYTPFCRSSLSLLRKDNSKLSTSAPVTPVTNLSSPRSTLSFAFNSNMKFDSKKQREKKELDRPLLHNEEETIDEVF